MTNAETTAKEFDLGQVITTLTGRVVQTPFGGQEVAEHVLGHPVWTHEMASESFPPRVRAAILAQVPRLADIDASDVVDEVTAREFMLQQRSLYGDTVTLEKGSSERTEGPIESLRRMVPDSKIITVSK